MALQSFTVTIITKSDSPFNVIPNAPIEIRERLSNGSSGGLSLIFSDSAGTVPITQTGATADTLGQFTFFAEAADYNAVYDNNGIPVTIAVDVGVTGSVLTDRIDRQNPDTLKILIDDSNLANGEVFNVKNFFTSSSDNLGGIWLFDSSVLKSTHDGAFIVSPTVPWNGLTGQPHQDFIDGVGETDGGGSGCLVRKFTEKRASDLKPLFIEQFLTGLKGRGILDAESINVTTEQNLVGSFAAGALNVTVTTGGDFDKGGHLTIKHDNGKYHTYHLLDVVGDVASLSPPLISAASATLCEKTWYNKAHPGKFYMRELAQRVATTTEYKLSLPEKRVMMSQFDTNPNDEIDTLTVVGGAGISYFDAANIGGVDVGSPVRFNIGRTALVSCTTVDDGAKSFVFQNTGAGAVNLRTVLSTGNSDTGIRIEVWDDSGETIPVFVFDIPAGASLQQAQYYDLPIQLKGSSNTFFVTITANILPTSGNIYIDQLDIYETTSSNNSIFSPDEKKTLVAFGDSWIEGDLGSTVEREPIPFRLQAELPFVKIINEGVGGNTAGNLLARFDADVAPLNPDYVLINTGTNDVYNPPSGTFFPNAVDAFVIQIQNLISKCQAIGAKPILIGVPALAESDGSFTNYELNDRARLYSQFITKRIARLISSTSVGVVSESNGVPTGAIIEHVDSGSGIAVRYADGTMICTRQIELDTSVTAGIVVSFPVAFLTATVPACSFSVQTIVTGNTTTAMKDAFIQSGNNTTWVVHFPTAGTATETFNLIAIGVWY